MKLFKIGDSEITNKKICSHCSNPNDPVLAIENTALCFTCIEMFFQKAEEGDLCHYCGEILDIHSQTIMADNNSDHFYCNTECQQSQISYQLPETYQGINEAMNAYKEETEK